MSIPQRSGARTISVGPEQRELLRVQILTVLSFRHGAFEDVFSLTPSELLAVAELFGDAFAVLDATGWTTQGDEATIEVRLTPVLVAELHRNVEDLHQTISDHRDARGDTDSAAERSDIDRAIAGHRRSISGLAALLAAYGRVAQG
jgi:hypothetical protein